MFPSDQRDEGDGDRQHDIEDRPPTPCADTDVPSWTHGRAPHGHDPRKNILPKCAYSKPCCALAGEVPQGHRWSRQGIARLSLYLHHQHSKLFLDGVCPFEAEDGTRQRTEPLVMTSSTPDVQSSLIIRRCPRQKRLGCLVHVPTREDAFPKSLRALVDGDVPYVCLGESTERRPARTVE